MHSPSKTPNSKQPIEGSSESESDEDSEESSSEELTRAQNMAAQRKAEAAERRAKAHEAALATRNKDDLRSLKAAGANLTCMPALGSQWKNLI